MRRVAGVTILFLVACTPVKRQEQAGGTPAIPSDWKAVKLSELGQTPMPFDGVLMMPPSAKTRSSTFEVGGKTEGAMAYVELASGAKVMLVQRAPDASDDPSMLKQMLSSTGKLVMDRRGPTWFMLGVQRGDGIAIQGETWGARPGFSCGAQSTVTQAQLEEVLAICSSLRQK